ncbi:XerC Integrase [uncultured Caudovirales phage]|uniref:Integrase n=1 Tax=uncultured Caudovirales phage TaxID=2100421 RepID=A0A6J7WU15_9CAUD|nr:XerC Integrase [uncultured Caudovirales phage]
MAKTETKLPRNLFWRDGSIWARFKERGRERRSCLHTTSVREAERKLQDLKAKLHAEATAPEQVAFREAAVEWDAVYLSGLKPKTAQRYRVSLRQLDPAFGDKMLSDISPRAIGKFVSDRTKAGATASTIKNDLTSLSTILRVAMSRGWADGNPVAAWDRRIIKNTPKVQRPPSRAQVETAIAYGRTHGKKALIDFLHQSGCRLSEATALKWSEVDFAAGTITLIETKRGQPRVIRMATPGGSIEPILRAAQRHPYCPFVFWYSTGIPFRQASSGLRDFNKRVAELEKKAGREFKPFRTHDLRHSFAIGWLNAGGDIYELSRHLGHTSVKTTEQFYLKWMDPTARDRYEARLRGASGPTLVWDAKRHQSGTTAVSQVPLSEKAKA